ncbi:34528_t:CDS:2, partial [Gigaspora margarita]
GFYAHSIKTYNRLDLLNWQVGIMEKRIFRWCHFLLLIKLSYSQKTVSIIIQIQLKSVEDNNLDRLDSAEYSNSVQFLLNNNLEFCENGDFREEKKYKN